VEGAWVLGLDAQCFLNRLRKEIAAITRHRLNIAKAMNADGEAYGMIDGQPFRTGRKSAKIFGAHSKLAKYIAKRDALEKEQDAAARLAQIGDRSAVQDAYVKQAKQETARSMHDLCAGLRIPSPTRWGTVGSACRDKTGADIVGHNDWLGDRKQIDYEPGKWLKCPSDDSHLAFTRVCGASLVPADKIVVQLNDEDSIDRMEILSIADQS
ncbi:unnamed protein product, partial [Amoebophrya sp. A25]